MLLCLVKWRSYSSIFFLSSDVQRSEKGLPTDLGFPESRNWLEDGWGMAGIVKRAAKDVALVSDDRFFRGNLSRFCNEHPYARCHKNSLLSACRKYGRKTYHRRLQIFVDMRYVDNCREVKQMEHRLMTEREKADIYMLSVELKKAGKTAEAKALKRQIPLPAYLAKFVKENMGIEYLLEQGWNLAEAEQQYGTHWLDR
jgi:hypothetical protein